MIISINLSDIKFRDEEKTLQNEQIKNYGEVN